MEVKEDLYRLCNMEGNQTFIIHFCKTLHETERSAQANKPKLNFFVAPQNEVNF